MRLKNHLSNEPGLSDLLNYAHLIEDGIIANKDGAFLMTYQFQGPDIQSASSAELNGLTQSFNRMATLLEDGWMLHVDEIRVFSQGYPGLGFFPDKVSALIDEERRVQYGMEGNHFENRQFLTFVWKFPLPLVKTTRHWFVEGLENNEASQSLTGLLNSFKETVERCIGLLSHELSCTKLSSQDLLCFLNSCITGEWRPIAVPPKDAFLDVILARRSLVGGYVPQIGAKHIVILSILGYVPSETVPGLLEEMGTYPLCYRWSNRFIPLSDSTASREINRYKKLWHNKMKGLSGIVREVLTGRPSDKIDEDARDMHQETEVALTANSNRTLRFGFWTSELVLLNEDLNLLEEVAKDLGRYLENCGFTFIKEDVNALDAWLGTIPGHGSCNVRRVFLSSMNLAHVLPLHSIWSGAEKSDRESLLPPNSPPLFYAKTTGQTPFRFHTDVHDSSFMSVIGPTGAGKSTLLGLVIAQFLRFEKARIFVFDKDYSHHALTKALNGEHYDLANAGDVAFCPLADLSSETKKMRARQFVEDLVVLQRVILTPQIIEAIYNAIESLSKAAHLHRNLTVLRNEVQHEEVRAALKYYTLDGPMKLLDATEDSFKTSYLQTFEMGWLLKQKPAIHVPILRYLFDQIDTFLEEADARTPTLIVLEEAWAYIGHEFFARQFTEWLKTLRKKNARIIFATQSLGDLYDPTTKNLTKITAAILESCYTRIYLPNPNMESEIETLYQKMDLSERQIQIIKQEGIQKRHYYLAIPKLKVNRLIELGLDENSMALSFVGLSKRKSKALLECRDKYKDNWVYYWLQENGHSEWAEYSLFNVKGESSCAEP